MCSCSAEADKPAVDYCLKQLGYAQRFFTSTCQMIVNSSPEIIVTLYEGHYHFGVAALLNSLVKAGFKGLLRIGYRGALPPWVSQLKHVQDQDYSVAPDLAVSFVPINPAMHFGYYKPQFMLDTFAAHPAAQHVFYFDPDIVVNAEWEFFTSWVQSGIALCLDNTFAFLHRNHPWRTEWKALAGVAPTYACQLDHYVNSGFVGVRRSNTTVLERWVAITEKYRAQGGTITAFIKTGHRAVKTDQDLLNAVMTVSEDLTYSVVGTEGMGFTYPAYVMSHAVSDVKPWKKNFLKALLVQGHAPNIMDKDYMRCANQPVAAYSASSFRLKHWNMRFSSMLGRLIASNR